MCEEVVMKKQAELSSKIDDQVKRRMEQAVKEMLRPPPIYMNNQTMTEEIKPDKKKNMLSSKGSQLNVVNAVKNWSEI